MLHTYLANRLRATFLATPDIAPAMGIDGAVSIRFEGGITGPGHVVITVPEGLENDAGQALFSMDLVQRVPLFVGIAADGQPSHLTQTEARMRIDPIHTAPGKVWTTFFLELGW